MRVFEVKDFIERFKEDFCFSPKKYDEKSMRLIDEIFGLLKKIKSPNDETWRFFVRADRGTPEEYKAYLKEGESACDPWTEAELEQETVAFFEEYPEEKIWLSFIASEYTDPQKGVYRFFGIDHTPCMRTEPESGRFYQFDSGSYEYDISDFLEWLKAVVTEVVEMLEAGTYNMELFKTLPYDCRTGKLRRSKYWEHFPGTREAFLEGMPEEDVTRFLSEATASAWDNPRKDSLGCMFEMGKKLFLHACGIFYRAAGMGNPDLSDWELFCLNSCSHGHGDGLADIGDTPEEFEDWLSREDEYDWGGHRWAIKDGSSRSRIMFYPKKEENGAWKFVLYGGELYSTVPVAKGYLALLDEWIPVDLPEAETMKRKLKGTDAIGIVPASIFPVHCYEMFPDEKVVSFANLWGVAETKEEYDRAICLTDWYSLDYVELADAE